MPNVNELQLDMCVLKNQLYYNSDTGFFSWSVDKQKVKRGSIAGYIRRDGYNEIRINYKKFFAHRLAWFYVYGKWPEKYIDHINGIRSDNRICNLRDVSKYEDAKNRSISKRNKTGQVGVLFDKSRNKYMSTIGVKDKTIFLGRFDNILNAISVRKKAEIENGFSETHGRGRSYS